METKDVMEPKGMLPLGLKMGHRIGPLVGNLYCVSFILDFPPWMYFFLTLCCSTQGNVTFKRCSCFTCHSWGAPLSPDSQGRGHWLSQVMHPSQGWGVAGVTESYYKISYRCIEMVGHSSPKLWGIFLEKFYKADEFVANPKYWHHVLSTFR